jgi:hypothetical protein
LNVVVDLVNKSKGYETKLTGFLGDLDTISKNNEKFHGSYNNFDINTAGVKNVQKTVVEEIINQYTDNGLNPNFAAPLRDGIFRNILAGANMKDIRQYLNIYILGGEDQSGKLHQYLNQTAQQAVDSYTGMINQQLNKDFKFTGYIISGSLIETSSSQCIYAVEHSHDPGGYLTFEEWNTVLDIARNNKKAKLIDGTTLVNLPINKLHWGCRHDFTPVIVKPAEPKKAVTVKKKAEPKKIVKPVELPSAQQAQAKSFYKEAKNKEEARQVVKDMFTNYTGMKIGGVTISSDIDTARMNRINAKLNELMNQYNLAKGAVGETQSVEVIFKSNSKHYGAVWTQGGTVTKMNFGDKTDPVARTAELLPETEWSRSKSRVDKENADLSTVVHEFGHVISVSGQAETMRSVRWENGVPKISVIDPDPKVVDFWSELKKIQKEYFAALRSARNAESQDNEKFQEIHLGQYAEENIREFMAESFTEYKLRANPSIFAKKVGLLIDKTFGK